MSAEEKDNNQQNTINVNVDPGKIEAQYTDAVFINHNAFGFSFDIAQNIPQMKMLKIINRVAMSPQHAKALMGALKGQIDAYEKNFGEIKMTPAMEQSKNPIGFNIEK